MKRTFLLLTILACLFVMSYAMADTLTLPAELTVIEEEAFYGTTSLDEVVVPEGATEIHSKAFADSSLNSIELPESINYIADDAFDGVDGLSVSAPEGSYASEWWETQQELSRIFANGDFYFHIDDDDTCSILSYIGDGGVVVVPDHVEKYTVTSIAEAAFYCCTDLNGILLPDTITSIKEYAFYGCISLESVTLPNSIVHIGDAAFRYSGLKEFSIPKDVCFIGEAVFSACENLENIYVDIENKNFLIQDNILFTRDFNRLLYCPPNNEIGDYFIPDGVKYIDKDAFYCCKNISSIVIPGSIKQIGSNAFYNSSLSEIHIEYGLEQIDDYAFYNTGLTSIDIPDSVTQIGDYAFGYTKLSHCKISKNVTSLSQHVFESCEFVCFEIPNGVTTISSKAFNGCSSLRLITIPPSVSSIADDAFNECCYNIIFYCQSDSYTESYAQKMNIPFVFCSIPNPLWDMEYSIDENGCIINDYLGNDESVIIPSHNAGYPVYQIGMDAFDDSCINHIVLPDTIEYIGNGAFYGSSLSSVTLPKSIKILERSCFCNCDQLASVKILGDIQYIGSGAFFDCESLETIHIANGTELTIGDVAFGNCPKLKSVIICGEVNSIDSAFQDNFLLESVYIEAGLTSIEYGLLSSCPNLRYIYIPASVKKIGYIAFSDECNELVIYGEAGSYAETYALENGIPFSTDPFPGTEQEEKFIHLSGSVTLADGTPLENIFVHVYDTCIENDVGIAYTDRNGNWSCSVSSNIAYIIRYDHPSYTITATEKTITPTKDTVLDTAIAVLAAGDGTITPTFVMQVNNASISDTGVMVGDIVTFTLSAEGAQKVRLIADGKAYNEYSLINGAAVIERSFSRSGTRQISFQAYDGTAWGSACAAQTLIVNADGVLATPVINAIETQYIGESFTVSWEQVEHAENYTVYLYHDDLLWPALSNTEKSTTSDLSMVIPGNLLYTDGEYLIEIIASGYRYNQASSSITFMVEKTSEGASITYPESGMSYSVGDTIHTRYTTGNGTKGVRLLVTAPDIPKKLYSPDESGVFYPVAEQVGNYTLTPYYSRNEEDFTETTADGCGNSITVIVNPPAISSLLQGNNKQYSIRYSGTAPVFNGSVSNERYTVKVYLNDTFVEEIIPAKGQFSYTAASIENVGKYVYSFVPCYNNLTGKAVEFPVYIIKQISSAVKYTPEPVNLFTKPDATANHLLPYGSAVTILGEYGSEYCYVTAGDLSGFLPANSSLVDTLVPETIDIVVTDSNDLPYTAVGESRLYQINADGAEAVNAIVTTHSGQKLAYEAIKTDDTFTVEIPTTEATAYCVTFDATGTNGKTFYSTERYPYIGVDTTYHWANHECWSNHKKLVPTYAVPNNPYWIAEQVDVSERRLICFGKTIDDLLCVAVAKQNGTLEKYMLIDQNELQLSKNITTYRALCIINPYNKDKYSGDPCEKNFHNIKKLLNNIDGITFEPPVLGGTSSDIFDALSTLNEKEDYNDVTYLYWSSHGSSWGTWEILPVLSTGKYDQFNFADLIMSQIYDVDGSDELKYAWEGKLNIIIDSCYSGLFVDYVLENEEYDIPRESVTALMSAQADENSIIDIWIGGYFTAELARQTTENTSLGELTNSIKISKTINGVTHTPHPVVWPAESSSHIFFTEDPDAVK